MIKEINITDQEETFDLLFKLKEKKCYDLEVRFKNVDLIKLNKLVKGKPFRKNDLYVNATTLFEIMQPLGSQGRHHYHDLKPEEIHNVLITLQNSKKVIPSIDDRYVVLTTVIASCGHPLIAIIDTHSPLMNDRNANINKLVTLYPKDIEEK